MAFPALVDAHKVPVHILFPEQYEASKRMIIRDFAFFGVCIVSSVLLTVIIGNAS